MAPLSAPNSNIALIRVNNPMMMNNEQMNCISVAATAEASRSGRFRVRDGVDAKVHALAGQFALPSSRSRQHGELTRSFLEFLIYSFEWWLRLTLSSGSSKRKTIATQSPEFGVAIAGALD